MFFSTCQVRISRLYISKMLAPSFLLLLLIRLLLLPPASSRSQWALPDLNCERRSSAGHQMRAPCNGHCHPSELQITVGTATSQWPLPNLNCELRGRTSTAIAGPQPRAPADLHSGAPDHSGHCRASTASSRSQWALLTSTASSDLTAGLQPRAPCRSQWALPDLNREHRNLALAVGVRQRTRQRERQNRFQIECQNRIIECQNECQIEWQNWLPQ